MYTRSLLQHDNSSNFELKHFKVLEFQKFIFRLTNEMNLNKEFEKILNQRSIKTELKKLSSPRLKKMRRSMLYSLIDAYAKERIDDLLKIGVVNEIHDILRVLGQRAADLYNTSI